MDERQKTEWEDLLSKKSFNKEEADKIQRYFAKFAGVQTEHEGDVMEEVPLDYSTLD